MASKKNPAEFDLKRKAINAEAARRRKARKDAPEPAKTTSAKKATKPKKARVELDDTPEEEVTTGPEYGVDIEGRRSDVEEEQQLSEERSTERSKAEAQKDAIDYEVGSGAVEDIDTSGELVRGMRGAGRASVSAVPMPAEDSTILEPSRPRADDEQARRVSRGEHARRKQSRIEAIRSGNRPKPVDTAAEAVAAGTNWVPSDIRATRQFSSFPVTPQESARRARFFGVNETPDDTVPTTGVRLNENTGAVTPFKAIPGTDVELERLSNLDRQVQKERSEVEDYVEAAKGLSKAASAIPLAVTTGEGETKPILTGGTRTSAGVEETEGNRPVRGGMVSDLEAGARTADNKSVRDLVAQAAATMGRSVSGTGSDRAATLGALLGGQFQPKAVIQQGRQVAGEGPVLPVGPALTARDAPVLAKWAQDVEENTLPSMPTEWDVEERGLVDVQGVPLREIDPTREVDASGNVTNPGISGPLEQRVLGNKRTTAAPGSRKLPPPPPVSQEDEIANAVDFDFEKEKQRLALNIQNEQFAKNADLRRAAMPSLRKKVNEAMGPVGKGVQIYPPRPYSGGAPTPPEGGKTGSDLNINQMHEVMKGARQAAGVGQPMTKDEDARQVLINEKVNKVIAKDYMESIPGVGEGSDTTGGIAGSRTGQVIAETGRVTPGGSPLVGASSVAGGPKSRSIKVRMRGGEERGVSGQPVIPESAPATSKNKNKSPEMTLPELKVIHPLLGSLYDRTQEGAGRAITVRQSSIARRGAENRPLTPGTVRFTRQIGGRTREFATNLSVVKPSGTVGVPRARGSFEDTGAFKDPSKESKIPKAYDYDYEKVETAPATGPETTAGTIVAGAGSVFRPKSPVAPIVGRVGDNIPGVSMDQGGNPVITDQAAAASNPAVIRSGMRGYRQQGIRAAKAESRRMDLDARYARMKEIDARQVDAERGMEALRRTTGASSGRTIVDTTPATALTPAQTSLRTRGGLPATPEGSRVAMAQSAMRASAYEKATDEAAKAGTPFPSLSEFPVENFPVGGAQTSSPAIDTGGRGVMEGDQWGMMKGAPTRRTGDRTTRRNK